MLAAEGIPEPPHDYSNPGQILGWMIACTFLLVVLWVARNIGRAGARMDGESVETPQVMKSIDPTNGRVVTSEVYDVDPKFVDTVNGLVSTQQFLQAQLSQAVPEIARLRSKIENLEKRDELHTRRELVMREYIRDLKLGVLSKDYPPFPEEPDLPE